MVLLGFSGFEAWLKLRPIRLTKDSYKLVELGMSKAEVLAINGQPMSEAEENGWIRAIYEDDNARISIYYSLKDDTVSRKEMWGTPAPTLTERIRDWLGIPAAEVPPPTPATTGGEMPDCMRPPLLKGEGLVRGKDED